MEDGKRNGQGNMTYANGNKYVSFKDSYFNGQGIFTFANGDKYVGTFKDSSRHGQGTLTYADGDIEEGIWENDEFLYAQKAPKLKSIAEKEIDKLRKENARLKKQQQAQSKKIAKKPVKKSPPRKSAGTGSGFFVSKLGHIVTNEHVVRNCGSITVGTVQPIKLVQPCLKKINATILHYCVYHQRRWHLQKVSL